MKLKFDVIHTVQNKIPKLKAKYDAQRSRLKSCGFQLVRVEFYVE
jgi:hypothetical protein